MANIVTGTFLQILKYLCSLKEGSALIYKQKSFWGMSDGKREMASKNVRQSILICHEGDVSLCMNCL